MEIFPSTTVATLTTGFFGVIASNIVPILGVLALMLGVGWVTRHLGKATKGRV
jgi:hypothetical protein